MCIAIVRWLCLLAAIGPIVAASRASAFTITESNIRRLAGVEVSHHEIGKPYGYSAYHSDALDSNTVNLGYARASSTNSLFYLTASSYLNGTQIGSMGLDFAIADGGASYQAELVFGGGTGPLYLRITPILETQAWQTGSTFSDKYIGQSGWAIFNDFDAPFDFTRQPDGSIDYTLEYGYRYWFVSDLNAYSYAGAGFETSRTRSLQLVLTELPEPSTMTLLALGLGGIAAARRRYGAAGRPGRSARTIAAGVARGRV